MQYTVINKHLTSPSVSITKVLKYLILLVFVAITTKISAQQVYTKEDSIFIKKIFDAALTQGQAYENLRFLCKQIGNRISGSEQAAKAVEFTYTLMSTSGYDTVFKQPVMVPHWVRGNVELGYIAGKKTQIKALGGSISTPKDGITAEVIEVQDIDELQKLGTAKVKGKIVFFNRPMDPKNIHTFVSYGGCVDQRWKGPSEAAKYGAVATICRSMTLATDTFPHTGSMKYEEGITKIPACAISTVGADILSAELKKGAVKFKLQLNCYMADSVLSANVVGQLNGNKYNSFIICGGHLDSWDVGEGAHDDGAGCVQSIEALRLLSILGYKPLHNLRAVMFMNEENGLKGGKKYAEQAAKNGEKTVFAIESDEGGFTPRGFHVDDSPATVKFIKQFAPLLAPYGLYDLGGGGGGADISPLRPQGTALLNYLPDSQRYFDYHHTDADVFEAVNPRELALGAASMAAMIYLMDKYSTK